jgi:hypothetical protein
VATSSGLTAIRLASVFALIAASVTSTTASTVTDYFAVTASGFVNLQYMYGSSVIPPVDPLKLSFSLTFDPSQSSSGDTQQGLVVTNINLPQRDPFYFYYD